jgi:uncharacterized delta-60 repeat protein
MNTTRNSCADYLRILAFTALGLYQTVLAEPGALDTTFGDNGLVVTPIQNDYDEARAIAIGNDGKIVVVGRSTPDAGRPVIAVARYNSDGLLDSGFNGSGIATTSIAAEVGVDDTFANAVVVQSDGKIVVAGRSRVSNLQSNIAVVRYNVDGTQDNTFDGGWSSENLRRRFL